MSFTRCSARTGRASKDVVKILAGIYRASQGDILVAGRLIDRPTPATIRSLGLGIVHQELIGLPGLAGQQLRPRPGTDGRIRPHRPQGRAARTCRPLRDSEPTSVRTCPPLCFRPGTARFSRSSRCSTTGKGCFVLDEPTASFTTEETRRLLGILLELKSSGMSILYVTHRLEEIEEIVDRVTVLRDGLNVGDLARDEAVQDRVISLMVGRNLGDPQPSKPVGDEVLFSTHGIGLFGIFEDVNLTVRPAKSSRWSDFAGQRKLRCRHRGIRHPAPEVGVADRWPPDDAGIAAGRWRSASAIWVRTAPTAFCACVPSRENIALAALERWSRLGLRGRAFAKWRRRKA